MQPIPAWCGLRTLIPACTRNEYFTLTTFNHLSPSDPCGQDTTVPNRAGIRPPLAAYPDTLTVLRWRGLRTVQHDAARAAEPECAARIEGIPQ